MIKQDEREEREEKFEGDRGIVTDVLCLRFSEPIFIAVLILFLFIIFYGFDFSFIHPEDEKGFRCGLNNSLYGAKGKDFSDLPIVGLNRSKRICMDECDGTQIFSYCIPNNFRELKKAPIAFKLADDFLNYWYILILFVLLTIAISLPVYFICAKFAAVLFGFSIFMSIIVTAFVSFYSLKVEDYASFTVLVFSIIGLVFTFFYYRRRISIISPIVVTGMSFLKQTPTTFLVIPILLFTGLCSIIFIIISYMFIQGIGEPKVSFGKMTLERHGSLIWTTILFILIGQWIFEFINTLMRIAVSRIVCHTYFRKKAPSLSDSVKHIIRFHAGTVFFGSFVCFLLDDIAYLLNRLKKAAEKTENKFLSFIYKLILMMSIIITKIAGDVNRLSFVFTALKGVSFWDSCKYAANAMIDSHFCMIEVVIHDVFWFIRMCVAATCSAIAYAVAGSIGLFKPSIFILVTGFVIYSTISSIESILYAASESVLVCVREDANTHGAQDTYAPPQLWEAVGFFSKTAVQPQRV